MHTYLPTRDMPVPITCPVRSGNGAKRKATVTINHYINVCYDKYIVAPPEIIQRNMKAANRSKCVHGYALPTHFKLPAVWYIIYCAAMRFPLARSELMPVFDIRSNGENAWSAAAPAWPNNTLLYGIFSICSRPPE